LTYRRGFRSAGLAEQIKVRFGKRLRELRTRADLSQDKLAAKAGMARNFVSMIENGQRNVTIVTVEKLAHALGCRLANLMPDAEDE
jgi:transcriptional regulator with XRE-family HTH domain